MMIKTAFYAALFAVALAGTASASMDEGKYGANVEQGKYGANAADGR